MYNNTRVELLVEYLVQEVTSVGNGLLVAM